MLYSRAPTAFATVECLPSAPITSVAEMSSEAPFFEPPRIPVTSPDCPKRRDETAKPSRTSAPAAIAASTSKASSTVRRGEYTASTSAYTGYVPERTAGPASKRTDRAGGQLSLPSRPQRWSRAPPGSWTWWVESVSLGKRARSTARTRRPWRASSSAVAAPATRVPTITTSYFMINTASRYSA
jgi:hypothetical protein